MNYLKRSITKFLGDFLSKVFYDVTKIILVALIPLLVFKIGYDSFFISIYSFNIFTIISYSIVLIVASIFCYSLIIRKRVKVLTNDLNTDKLTGLPNDRALNKELQETIVWAKKENKIFSLILMDIDDFKSLNEHYGYSAADEILVKLGEILRNDKRLTDRTYRQHVKGDEFIIIARETSLDNAWKAADRKRDIIARSEWKVENVKDPLHLTVSCGVTQLNEKDDSTTIINRAFEAMKAAKSKEGKNTVISRV